MGKTLSIDVESTPEPLMVVVHIAEPLDILRKEEELRNNLCRGKLNKADARIHDDFMRSIHGS
ncbi:MAG: hypothetical protein QG654_229 [Patescibacteria group bacterium]|jgi:hypothetical protein|nr:hypothetical protein [Patescibacteria group bacterium]